MSVHVVTSSLPAFDCHLIKEDILRDRALEIIDNYHNEGRGIEFAIALVKLLERLVPEAEEAVNEWIEKVDADAFWAEILKDFVYYYSQAGIIFTMSPIDRKGNNSKPGIVLEDAILEEYAFFMDLSHTTLCIAKKKAVWSFRDLSKQEKLFSYLKKRFLLLRPHFDHKIKVSPYLKLLKDHHPDELWLNF